MLYLGLMSGTSMDGIDAALVDFNGIHPQLIDFDTFSYPPSLLHKLEKLCGESHDELFLMGQTDREVGKVFAQAVNELLMRNQISPDRVKAIGSHGQTIRHFPDEDHGFTLQIGDANTIAALTGIDVIADFRRKDIALGGQGAPLVPAFHQAVFSSPNANRVVLNIGGIANITYLPAAQDEALFGYDTGPGNTLMDAWCQKHQGQAYDASGAWAAAGRADEQLLQSLLSHPYFHEPAPKSTGKEVFNLTWLEQQLAVQPKTLNAQQVQTTLAHFSCQSIVQEIHKLPKVDEVYVCGGGAHNEFLIECLESELFDCDLYPTDELGVKADVVEAMAFAWMAYAFQQGIPTNVPNVTGASRPALLGAWYPAG